VKLIFKEELIPEKADKVLFVLAPVITSSRRSLLPQWCPGADGAHFWARHRPLGRQYQPGVLYVLTVTSISVYGITLAGWSSNNKYATLGGLRATAQMISYELALGMAMLGRSCWQDR